MGFFGGLMGEGMGNDFFLGHLSHSGDLLLWIGVRRCASFMVRRAWYFVR